MTISYPLVTLLPPANASALRRAKQKLVNPPICPKRLAEAEQADIEFSALCEEVSRVHKRPKKRAHGEPKRETRPR